MTRPLRQLLLAASLLGLASGAAESGWRSRIAVCALSGTPLQPGGHWIVVVFLSPECPVANADIPVLNYLAAEFGPRSFGFPGAYADLRAELTVLRRHAAGYHLGFAMADTPLFSAAVEQKMREKIAELTPGQCARHNWDEVFGR